MKFLVIISILIFSGSANVALAKDDPAITACELELRHRYLRLATGYKRISATVSNDQARIGYAAVLYGTRKHDHHTCSFVLIKGRYLLANDKDWYPEYCRKILADGLALIKSIKSGPGSDDQKQESRWVIVRKRRACRDSVTHAKRIMRYYKFDITFPMKALNIYPIAPSNTELSVPQKNVIN